MSGFVYVAVSLYLTPRLVLSRTPSSPGEELRAGDPNLSTGNYGLQDQRLAFDWVRRNIGETIES